MQQFKIFLTVLLAVVLVLAGYEWYNQRRNEHMAQVNRERDEQLAKKLEQEFQRRADKIEREHRKKDLQTEQENQALAQKVTASARVAEALVLSSAVKTQVAQYFAETGRLPASNQALGLPAPESYHTSALTRLEVGPGGVIELSLNEKSGVDQGRIRLIPDPSQPGIGLQWQCVTPSYRELGAYCEYQP